jgi:hypothetical protein
MESEKEIIKSDIRKIKIYSKYVQGRFCGVIKPELRITANYLNEYGFKSGTCVEVHCMPNELRIIIVKKPE